ncbi:MAG: TAXI family TRAP transporter solute-binding subunit [Alphaproteobacteria bacterium]|nr:TAXI family TRAP transporter solute-binding subunit [Alphaproteobacteria bacterium]
MTKLKFVAGTVVALSTIAWSGAQAKDFYKMSTITLPSAFAINTTFAKIIQKYHPEIEIQVNATGKAPRHALDAARGKTDFLMGAPALHHLMSKGKKMFAKVKNAKKLAHNLRAVFNYRIGFYQFGVFESSGIKSLADLKGKRVFLGPPAGVQTIVAGSFVKAITGLVPGKDYKVVKLGFSPAMQAFQDRQLDVLVATSNPPAANFVQAALTNKIRFLGASDADWKTPAMKKLMRVPGRTSGQFAADAYGKNQANTKPVQTIAAWVGLVTRKDIPDDVIYKMTKTFWEHIDEMYGVATWAKEALNLKSAFSQMNMKLHPGALRYYKEIGLKIPRKVM